MASNTTKPCLGFDFGGVYMKLALTDKKGISRIIVEEFPEGIFKDGDITAPNSALVLLREVLKKHRVKAKECAFILPPGKVLFRQLSTPVMDAHQIRKNLPFEFRDLISGKKEDYFFDYAIGSYQKNADGEVTGLNLMISAVQRKNMESYIRFFNKLGIKLRVAAPLESAFSNIIRTYEANHLDVPEGRDYCFLDIGHSATRIHLYSGPLFQATRVIEYGGAMVESAIARDLNIDLSAARAYKENSQEATRYLKETSTAYTSIALEIRKAVNFYSSNEKELRKIETIYCCGGGGWMTPLLDTIREGAGLEIRPITELLPPNRNDAEGGLNLIGAVAVGITLQ